MLVVNEMKGRTSPNSKENDEQVIKGTRNTVTIIYFLAPFLLIMRQMECVLVSRPSIVA